MRYTRYVLLIALCLITGCGTPQNAGNPSANAGATSVASAPSPTAEPSPEPPTQVPAPTATLIPTSKPTPTTAPPTPTAEPSPTSTPATPTSQPDARADLVAVSRGTILLAIAPDGSTRPIEIEGMNPDQAVFSPDGSWIAGAALGEMQPNRPGPQAGLILYNRQTGAQQTLAPGTFINTVMFSPDSRYLIFMSESYDPIVRQLIAIELTTGAQKTVEQIGHPQSMWFSPDSASVAFSVVSWEPMLWQLNVLELATGQQRTLLEGDESLGHIPYAWLPQGILTYTYLVFGADALPESIHLIDPEDGSLQTLLAESHGYAVPSRDGKHIALIQGTMGVGVENPVSSLSILNPATDETRVIEPEQTGGGYIVDWSPDSTKLLYKKPDRENAPGPFALTGPDFSEPQPLNLPFEAQKILDFHWRDANTLLMLVDEGEREKLYELQINAADPGALREVASFAAPSTQGSSAIRYVPVR